MKYGNITGLQLLFSADVHIYEKYYGYDRIIDRTFNNQALKDDHRSDPYLIILNEMKKANALYVYTSSIQFCYGAYFSKIFAIHDEYSSASSMHESTTLFLRLITCSILHNKFFRNFLPHSKIQRKNGSILLTEIIVIAQEALFFA